MRLIDADWLQEKFAKEPMENRTYLRANEIVAEAPTAYDVDKVVERLERDSQNIEIIYPTDQGYDYEDAVGIDINKAKEIVKSGGIE